ARRRLRRACDHPARLRARDRPALPLLQLRRRYAAGKSHSSGRLRPAGVAVQRQNRPFGTDFTTFAGIYRVDGRPALGRMPPFSIQSEQLNHPDSPVPATTHARIERSSTTLMNSLRPRAAVADRTTVPHRLAALLATALLLLGVFATLPALAQSGGRGGSPSLPH